MVIVTSTDDEEGSVICWTGETGGEVEVDREEMHAAIEGVEDSGDVMVFRNEKSLVWEEW